MQLLNDKYLFYWQHHVFYYRRSYKQYCWCFLTPTFARGAERSWSYMYITPIYRVKINIQKIRKSPNDKKSKFLCFRKKEKTCVFVLASSMWTSYQTLCGFPVFYLSRITCHSNMTGRIWKTEIRPSYDNR